MIGVFIDTFVVLTMTALVVISTLYAGNGPLSQAVAYDAAKGGLTPLFAGAFSKTGLAQQAFGVVFNKTFANVFVAICLFFFAFSTILSWNLFGKINANYLFGKKGTLVYTIVAIGFIFLGSVFQNDLVWELTDFFNYLMVIPNVIALAMLSGMVVSSACKKKACCCCECNKDAAAESEDAE
jgi:AGCS family alanine or glycine:cation symporter